MSFIAGTGKRDDTACINRESYDDTGWECYASSSFFHNFAMLLGQKESAFLDWDKYDWDPSARNDWLQAAISFFFSIVVGILLLNILIAVVSNVFSQTQERSEQAFWTTRLAFMTEINAIRKKLCNSEVKDSKDSQYDKKLTIRRTPFSQYDDDWIRSCPSEDLEAFFKWWYYAVSFSFCTIERSHILLASLFNIFMLWSDNNISYLRITFNSGMKRYPRSELASTTSIIMPLRKKLFTQVQPSPMFSSGSNIMRL